MKPVPFADQNFIFRKPDNMTDKECGDLPCFVDKINSQVVSCWELSEEEKKQIAETGKIWVGIKAFPVPPMFLCTINPINQITIEMNHEAVKALQDNGTLPKLPKRGKRT